MLVLSRKLGERIVVPSCEVAVTVLEVRGNTVRLGITAPANTKVFREEVWSRMNEEQDLQSKEHSPCAGIEC